MSLPGRVMGIDHGQARIGVAISDPMRLFARPLRIIMHSSREADLAEIECIIDTEQVSKVVIGLPTDSEGGVGSQARIAIRWAKALSQTIAVPIVFWDESYSSQSAAALRPRASKRAGRHSGKGQPADDLAAAIMLQDYLEAGGAENEPGWPLESLSHYD